MDDRKTNGQDAYRTRVALQRIDSLDEELEMELDDDRLDRTPADDPPTVEGR